MNPEIQRLTNLRNFFITKREACEEEVRLQESQIKLWRESESEVEKSIAQAEKEQPKVSPTSCGICKQPNCICNVAAREPFAPPHDQLVPGKLYPVNQAAKDNPADSLKRCTKCGCVYASLSECHCQKTRPA